MTANPLAPFRASPASMPPGAGDWAKRHNLALETPRGTEERRLVRLLRVVGDLHATLKDDAYGAPTVLAPLLQAACAYLNFECGRDLDMATIDGALRRLSREAGLSDDFEPKEASAAPDMLAALVAVEEAAALVRQGSRWDSAMQTTGASHKVPAAIIKAAGG